jgi:hypothetical protein
LERDAKLKKAGLDKEEGFVAEKLAEVREIASETERIVKQKTDVSESEIPKPTSEATDNTATLSQVSPVSHTSCTTSSIPPEDTSLLDHLESHYLGELPQSSFKSNSQTASEMAYKATASEKVISEDPQQQQLEPVKTTSPPKQQPTNTPTKPQITKPPSPKPDVPEPTVPEQTVSKPVPEPTKSLTVSLPDQTIQITRYDGISLTSDMDLDSEDDQDDHSSNMAIDPIADQPSTSQPLTTNDQPTTSQAIVPIAPPKPSKQPSPPTIFLDSRVLQDV